MELNYYSPIIVDLIEDRWHYDEKDKLPSHNLVIRPLLANCIYGFVYGLKNDNELFVNNIDILVKDRGKHKIDTTKERYI